MAKITGEKIWKALLRDKGFMAEVLEGHLATLESYAVALPDILKDQLDEPVTLESLLQAKVTFVQYCLDNGFIRSLLLGTALKATQSVLMGDTMVARREDGSIYRQIDRTRTVQLPGQVELEVDEAMVSMMESALQMALEALEGVVADIPGFLESMGEAEEQILQSESVGLSPKNLRRLRRGKLTIGDVLLSQPAIIVQSK